MTTVPVLDAIKELKSAEEKKQVRAILEPFKLEVQALLMKEAMESLDNEIEFEIKSENTNLAMFKLAQFSLLEEQLYLVERILIKQAIMSA